MPPTPGPWTAENSGLLDIVYALDSAGEVRRICELIGPNTSENARLIAAAPDLLMAVQVLICALPHEHLTAHRQGDEYRHKSTECYLCLALRAVDKAIQEPTL